MLSPRLPEPRAWDSVARSLACEIRRIMRRRRSYGTPRKSLLSFPATIHHPMIANKRPPSAGSTEIGSILNPMERSALSSATALLLVSPVSPLSMVTASRADSLRSPFCVRLKGRRSLAQRTALVSGHPVAGALLWSCRGELIVDSRTGSPIGLGYMRGPSQWRGYAASL